MSKTCHAHWRDADLSRWRWPNFSPAEIACRGAGKLLIDEEALNRLQALRDTLGKPLIVRPAYRSPEHNRAVGGAAASRHLDGAAFDIAMANHDPEPPHDCDGVVRKRRRWWRSSMKLASTGRPRARWTIWSRPSARAACPRAKRRRFRRNRPGLSAFTWRPLEGVSPYLLLDGARTIARGRRDCEPRRDRGRRCRRGRQARSSRAWIPAPVGRWFRPTVA